MAKYWRKLLDTALDQHGYVTSRDARQLDIPVAELGRLARRDQLVKVGHGIYRFEELVGDSLSDYMLATLWPDGRGVLSHDTMLDLYQLCDVNPDKIHITVPNGYRARATGGEMFTVHHANLSDMQLGWFEGIRAVTPRTAIYQCVAGGTPNYLLRQAIESARNLGHITAADKAELEARLEGDSHERPLVE
ncbi:MAG TPA: type IV toxin-antitoxin system AbiEi family antitoxin domain-containing protein [Stackebrandtia sp.]|uniref:type IV toxin-antitoxin system AbiEi family antitoxin domain-containing protein n=1 Tax=Stackebrandtia sp. TaxID=2023065 RepID=UPI002D7639B5|nr:type IV toxin-antitoxin system AbiEi family antitoxin domain-containing protein [Stackebrandtia sp.]HZE40579.1 type IV toxin-antitoxin system AbiEi family antitoxin domain-containing protein [Stackebrandtia sp.]